MTGYNTALAKARVIRDCLIRHGVPEVSIQLVEGRPSVGDRWNSGRFVSVTSHHIASYPTVKNPTPGQRIVARGRPGLDGPLANGTAGVDLVFRILTLGYANHPGLGGPLTVSGPLGSYRIPKDNARAYAFGIEYEGGFDDATWNKTYTNKRTGKSMTFREFMGRCNAGMVEAIWLINGMGKHPTPGMDLSGYHMEHKTWAPTRKVDRRNYTTSSGRAEIKKYNTAPLPLLDLSNMQGAAHGKIKVELQGVKRIKKALNEETGSKLNGASGFWTPSTTAVYKKWQQQIGNPPKFCDGIPGKNDLGKLGAGRFRIVA